MDQKLLIFTKKIDSFSSVPLFCFFYDRYYVAQAGLELLTFLCQVPRVLGITGVYYQLDLI
jgi:hypothetical protein